MRRTKLENTESLSIHQSECCDSIISVHEQNERKNIRRERMKERITKGNQNLESERSKIECKNNVSKQMHVRFIAPLLSTFYLLLHVCLFAIALY